MIHNLEAHSLATSLESGDFCLTHIVPAITVASVLVRVHLLLIGLEENFGVGFHRLAFRWYRK